MKGKHRFKKFIFETLGIIIGISISFWLNNMQENSNIAKKEVETLKAVKLNILEIESYIKTRLITLDDENNFMDYLSGSWNNLNLDSVVNVLQNGRHIKSFHNLFLDYREFHPPISEIKSIINDGSIALISNHGIKLKLISLMDNNFDYVNQNVKSEIELQQSFREELLKDKSLELSKILEITSFELRERLQGKIDYEDRILKELKAIVKLNSAKNYLNLKIRQRYWVMNFLNGFSINLNEIKELVNAELLIKSKP
jgi:hypothetical protein